MHLSAYMESGSIPSLTELAAVCIQKSINTLTIDAKLRLFANILVISSPSVEKLKANLIPVLFDAFPFLCDKFSEEYLIDILGDDLYNKFKKDYDDLQKDIKYIKSMRGSLIDREIIQCHKDENGFYPYNALKCGVEWPKDVVVTKREEYLSDQEFQHVFKMSKEEFNVKDKIFKARLKKEVGLF